MRFHLEQTGQMTDGLHGISHCGAKMPLVSEGGAPSGPGTGESTWCAREEQLQGRAAVSVEGGETRYE
jgi:hypothetical protein